jgi:hypothetical protein
MILAINVPANKWKGIMTRRAADVLTGVEASAAGSHDCILAAVTSPRTKSPQGSRDPAVFSTTVRPAASTGREEHVAREANAYGITPSGGAAHMLAKSSTPTLGRADVVKAAKVMSA